jgi:hypothetical protein
VHLKLRPGLWCCTVSVMFICPSKLHHNVVFDYMKQSPWEANSHSSSSILWKPKVHYHVHKRQSLVPILNHLHPVHNLSPCLLTSILILSSHLCLGLPEWSFSFRFSYQNLVCSNVVCYHHHHSHAFTFLFFSDLKIEVIRITFINFHLHVR